MSCYDTFRRNIKNQIIIISIHSFNDRPHLWLSLQTRVALAKVPNFLNTKCYPKFRTQSLFSQIVVKTFPTANSQQAPFPSIKKNSTTPMTQIPDESFKKSVRNQIRIISIKSFNARPALWDELKVRIIQSPVRDSLKQEALSQV